MGRSSPAPAGAVRLPIDGPGEPDRAERDRGAGDDLVRAGADGDEREDRGEQPFPPAIASATPVQGPEAVAPSVAASAPASIIPSMPRFSTPERWVSVSPVAASRSGVATRTAAARNPPTSTTASISAALRAAAPAFDPIAASAIVPPRRSRLRQQHDEDHHRLDHVDRHRRDPGLALHRARARLQRAEEEPGEHDTERVKPAEQRHRDGGEPVAGREVLEQRVGDAGHLDAAGQPGDRAGQRERRGGHPRLSILPLISAARGLSPTARSWNPQSVRVKRWRSTTAPASASRMPAWSRVPGSSGSRADSAMASLWG